MDANAGTADALKNPIADAYLKKAATAALNTAIAAKIASVAITANVVLAAHASN